jgi:3-deoxy-7-phosphoheptulonate synthase
MPVGFKNGTDGSIQTALDAIEAARGQHCFLSVTKDGVAAIVRTRGNEACHVILRGGKGGTNFDVEAIANVTGQLAARGLPPTVMVDCSHGNSRKQYELQLEVLEDVAQQIVSGNKSIMGVMVESNICAGNQPIPADPQEIRYGVSITDACIDWPTTETALRKLADELRNVLPGRR